MKKIIVLCLFVIVVIMGGSPYWTLYQLKNAYDSKDTDTIIHHINFPKVKQNLKQQLTPVLHEKAQHLTQIPLLKTFNIHIDSQAMIEKMLNRSLDTTLTPNHVKLLLSNTSNIDQNTKILGGMIAIALGKIDIQTLLTARNQTELQQILIKQLNKPNPNASNKETSMKYCGFNCFNIHTQAHGYPITVKMQRQGLINWQVTAIQLPL